MAKVLALIDPALANRMLEPISAGKGQGDLGIVFDTFLRQDWFVARCLADPVHAPAWVDEAIVEVNQSKEDSAFDRSGLGQLAQVLLAAPERRLGMVMGYNSGLSFPDDEE
jgi:hypothetical protein